MKSRHYVTQKGFTLVEIIVVVTVISILASVSFYGYDTARKQARDTQRVDDLKTIATALELYEFEHGYFPRELSELGDVDRGRIGVSDSKYQAINAILDEYLDEIPGDPRGPDDDTYHYYYDGWHQCKEAYVPGQPLSVVVYAKTMEIAENGNHGDLCSVTDSENPPTDSTYMIIIGENHST